MAGLREVNSQTGSPLGCTFLAEQLDVIDRGKDALCLVLDDGGDVVRKFFLESVFIGAAGDLLSLFGLGENRRVTASET